MKFRFILILIFSTQICIGTNLVNDSLLFIVYGSIVTDSLHKPILDANVRIISTNGTDTIIYPDSKGEFIYQTNEIGSFRLSTRHRDYYNSEHFFTTINLKKDSVFNFKFEMKEIISCVMYIPVVNFEEDKTSVPHDSLKHSFNLMKENPTLIFNVIGHQSVNEKKAFQKNVQN